MNETFALTLAWLGGMLLGAIFFGGLWWTVRKAISSPLAGFWFLGSMLVRMSIVLSGFYFIFGGRWQRLVLCLLGFVTARLIVTWLTRLKTEVSYAP